VSPEPLGQVRVGQEGDAEGGKIRLSPLDRSMAGVGHLLPARHLLGRMNPRGMDVADPLRAHRVPFSRLANLLLQLLSPAPGTRYRGLEKRRDIHEHV
jgi:hypothetical protein